MREPDRLPLNPELPPRLDVVQRWFHAVVTHPDGVGGGVESSEAQGLFRLGRGDLEQVVRRSTNLSAAERIGIYASAYYARLLECLRESFPVLARALGRDLFDEFTFEYLQRHPPRSYTLNRLGERFPQFLGEVRPDRPADGSAPPVGWPDFLVDLARLEWTIEQVFDGPGCERDRPLRGDEVRDLPPDRWADVRLVPTPCLTLLRFRYPVNGYYTAARRVLDGEDDVPVPAPHDEYIVLNRRDYVVRRHEVDPVQFALLAAIRSGATLADAIADASAVSDAADARLAGHLRDWFAMWTAAGFFRAVELPGR